MPVFDWTRTQLDKEGADGSTSLVMYWDQMRGLDPLKDDIHLPGWDASYTQDQVRELITAYGELGEDGLWKNIEYFLKNSVIECYYVGNDDIDDVIALVSEKFSGSGRESVSLEGCEKALSRDKNDPIKTLEETMNVSQARLNIGLTCDTVMRDSDYYAMSVFNEIFGGSSVSKLFMNVREKQSLCYYCYSSLSSATGTMQIGCGIKSENREKAYAEIENQLREMQKGNFDDGDIETAKRTIISGILQVSDNPAAITAFKFRRFLAGVTETEDEAIERINAVRREEIIAAANSKKLWTPKIFNPFIKLGKKMKIEIVVKCFGSYRYAVSDERNLIDETPFEESVIKTEAKS
jgi:Zn-dependent M16 (insulinase) family peptidase